MTNMLRNRQELAQLFRDNNYKIGAEIGVFDGYYSEILCRTIPNLELYSIDAWTVYEGYRDHKFVSSMQRAYDSAKARLEPFNCHIIQKFSMDAVKDFEDENLDFVYIDGNHEYSHVKQDIEEWTKKVRKGGIVAGDDYYMTRAGNLGVIKAVHEYVDKHNYKLQLTGWDLTNKKEDDQQPQWWFYKESPWQ